MSKKNSLQHVFSFEDLYQSDEEESSDISQDNDKKYELGAYGITKRKSSILTRKGSDYDYKKKLSKNSRLELFIRILIFSLMIIFIPLSFMVTNNFNRIEVHFLFKKVQNLIPKDILLNLHKNLFFILKIIQDQDFMLGLSSVFYILIHPYISLKLISSSAIFCYVITLMKFINQSRRPSWEKMEFSNLDDMIICDTSFSSPSEGMYFISFYFIYPIFCIRSFYLKERRMNIFLRIFITLIYLALMVLEYLYLLIYKLNYLHEIIFTHMLTFVFICILIDFDGKLHKKLFNSTKNIFKMRKNKIKILLFCLALCFIGILLYNFISPNRMLLTMIEKFSFNESCSQELKETFGMERTFLNFSYVFSMLGAYWGACLNIEYNPGEWWYQPLIIDESEMDKIKKDNNNQITLNRVGFVEVLLLILKSIFMIALYFSIWYGFRQIPYITFEFNFLMRCIKYFSITFVCFGILPNIFGFLHMNKKVEDIYDNLNESNDEIKDWSKNLFAATLFVNYQEKARYPLIHLKRN